MRQVGTSAHAGLDRLTQEQYEHFAQSPAIRDISFDIVLAIASNPALDKLQCEIRYAEDKAAKWKFSYPSVGEMPRKDGEIAMSSLVLDRLGIPKEIGQSVPLMFEVKGNAYEKNFRLVGYWEGDPVAHAQQIWVSEHFVQQTVDAAPAPGEDANDAFEFAGKLNASILFRNAFNIERKVVNLLAKSDYDPNEISFGINWAYMNSQIEMQTVLIGVFLLALILISGYLIIYSVFLISVGNDIRFYGLLKTLGATGRQIGRIVRGQALAIFAAGIIPGLAIGWLAGYLLTPFLMRGTAYSGALSANANPFIFIFAAAFSLITMLIGCRKPAKTAAKVSPVEAVRYTEASPSKSKAAKRTTSVSMFSMAFANVVRAKKRFAIAVLSMSLSLILLNSIVSAVKGFDLDMYLEHNILSDFAVSDASLINLGRGESNGEGVTQAFLDELPARAEAQNIGNIYFREAQFRIPEDKADNFERLKAALDEVMPQVLFEMSVYWATGIDAHVYGVGGIVAEQVIPDAAKLASGKYVYVSGETINGENLDLFDIGDSIALENDEGKTEHFEVIGVFETEDYHYSATIRHSHPIGQDIVMDEAQFLDFYGAQQPMQTNFNVREDRIEATEAWLRDYTEQIEPSMAVVSRAAYRTEFDGMRRIYLSLGGWLAFILAMIGILNFTNTITASFFSRRHEFATLQSIGMTGRQLRTMTFFEGLFYAAFTATCAFAFSLVCGRAITEAIAGQIWFYKQSFTVTPALYCMVPLIAICAAIPLICYRRLKRESLSERLRME
jgi:putative ABC transport system permease protein